MPEFEVPPKKLDSMRTEHAGNTYLSWTRQEADRRCRLIFQERFTSAEVARFQGKVTELGGLDQMAVWIREQPGYVETKRRVGDVKSQFIAEMTQSHAEPGNESTP